MPPKKLTVLELLQKGSRPSSPSTGSRAERSLAELFGLKFLSPRRVQDFPQVLRSLGFLFRQLEMPAQSLLLDVLLVVYMLWRACDDRGRLTGLPG